MQSHGSTLSANYTKVANDLLSRSDVDLGAKGLHGYLLIREGWLTADIKTLSAKFHEPQAKISRWLRQLAEAGYLLRRKVRDACGKWRTLVAAFDSPRTVPGADMSSTTYAELSQLIPSLGWPSLGPASVPPSGDKTGDKTPPTPTQEPAASPVAEPVEEAAMSESAAVLIEVGQLEPRLRMSALQMAPLLPLVAAWQARGVRRSQIVQACTERLPERIFSPAKLLDTRLRRNMPEKASEPLVEPTVAEVLARPVPQEGLCGECHRPMLKECAHCGGGEQEWLGVRGAATRGAGEARKMLAATLRTRAA